MNLLRRWFPTDEQKVFLAAAEEAFERACATDSTAADIYRQRPGIKWRHRRAIRRDLLEVLISGRPSELSQRLRTRFAEILDALTMDHFYTNLGATERLYIAKFSGSTRETWDRDRYFGIAHDFAYATVLEFIIFNSWNGSEESKNNLKEMQRAYVDMCKAHCEVGLQAAAALANDRPLTDAEREQGRTAITFKEFARRKLSGESIAGT
jgi:hypothetical protein